MHLRLVRTALLAVSSFAWINASANDLPPLTLCHFSLNNDKETAESQKFVEKLKGSLNRKVDVVEMHDPSRTRNASESFRRMVESGRVCNGLVISGHNSGSIGGDLAREETLSIELMERLSCDPKTAAWFENVQALWMQGCRSLGVGKIEANANSSENLADAHAFRVGAVAQEDGLLQGHAQLAREFTATLDQDNPVSSRLLRIFPRATVMGWTKTAPGKNAASQYALGYHIAHMTAVSLTPPVADGQTDDRAPLFENPCLSGRFKKETQACYAQSLVNLLDRLNSGQNERKICQDAVKGWISMGHPRMMQRSDGTKKLEYGFDNRDIQAHMPLALEPNPLLEQAKRDNCALNDRSIDEKGVLKLVDSILSNQESIGYSFNSLITLMNRYKNASDPQDWKTYQKIKQKLSQSSELERFIDSKLASNTVSLVRKIDYYSFGKEVLARVNPNTEKSILKLALAHLEKNPKTDARPAQSIRQEEADIRVYQQLLFHSMIANHLPIDDAWAVEALKRSAPRVLSGMISVLNDVETPALDYGRFLNRALDRIDAEPAMLRLTAHALLSEGAKRVDGDAMISRILAHPRTDSSVIATIVEVLGRKPVTVKDPSALLQELLRDPQVSEQALRPLATAVQRLKLQPDRSLLLYSQLIGHPSAGEGTLWAVAVESKKAQLSPEMRKEIQMLIQNHPKADERTKKELNR